MGGSMSDLLHVLCVDDEPKVLEGLALNLRRHFRVSMAMNGQTGLTIVEGADPPAIVISDMRMPEMDGASFLSQVKARSPDTVRLLLTGQTDIESAMARPSLLIAATYAPSSAASPATGAAAFAALHERTSSP